MINKTPVRSSIQGQNGGQTGSQDSWWILRLQVKKDERSNQPVTESNQEVKEELTPGKRQNQDTSLGQGGKRKVKVTLPDTVPDSNSMKRQKLSIRDHFKSL